MIEVEDVYVTVDPRDNEEVLAGLGRELRRNYLQPDELAGLLDTLGADKLAEHLREHKYPTDISIRRGDFGEAVTAGVFRHNRRYCVPVLKLRFKHSPNQPVQGHDVIAFRFTGDKPVVALPEVKTRTRPRPGDGRKALDDLSRLLDERFGEAITFAHAHTAGRHPTLATRIATVLDLASGARQIERHIVLVIDADRWNDTVIEAIRVAALDTTKVTVVHLPRLGDLVDAAFAAAATTSSSEEAM